MIEELKPTRKRRGEVPPAEEAKMALGDEYVSPLREPGIDSDPLPQDVIDEAEHLGAFASVFEQDLTPQSKSLLDRIREAPAIPVYRGLHAKLAEMLAEIGHVQKTGQAPSGMGGFKFTEASHLAEIIRGSLASKKISMLPEKQEIAESTEFKSASNKTQFLATVLTTWRLTDAETGETVTFQSFGSGQDNSDKAFPKAMTNSMKYAMLMGWLVPQGDDPENFQNEEKADPVEIKIESSAVEGVKQGGRQTKVTEAQIAAIRKLARDKQMEPTDVLHVLEQVMNKSLDHAPDEPAEMTAFLIEVMGELTFDQAANVVSMLTAVE